MQTRNQKAFLYFRFDTLQIHKTKRDENLTLIIIYNFESAREFEEWFKSKTKKSSFMTHMKVYNYYCQILIADTSVTFMNFLVVHVFSRLS